MRTVRSVWPSAAAAPGDGLPLRYNQPGSWLPDLLLCRPGLADQLTHALAELPAELTAPPTSRSSRMTTCTRSSAISPLSWPRTTVSFILIDECSNAAVATRDDALTR